MFYIIFSWSHSLRSWRITKATFFTHHFLCCLWRQEVNVFASDWLRGKINCSLMWKKWTRRETPTSCSSDSSSLSYRTLSPTNKRQACAPYLTNHRTDFNKPYLDPQLIHLWSQHDSRCPLWLADLKNIKSEFKHWTKSLQLIGWS